jgi:hypothetical protein
MEESVDQQALQLFGEGDTLLFRLTTRHVQTDHDVAEHRAPKVGVISLEQGKGQDVRGTRARAMRGVQFRDLRIPDQRERKFRVRSASDAEQCLGEGQDLRAEVAFTCRD